MANANRPRRDFTPPGRVGSRHPVLDDLAEKVDAIDLSTAEAFRAIESRLAVVEFNQAVLIESLFPEEEGSDYKDATDAENTPEPDVAADDDEDEGWAEREAQRLRDEARAIAEADFDPAMHPYDPNA